MTIECPITILQRVVMQNDRTAIAASGACVTSGCNIFDSSGGALACTLAAPQPGDRCTLHVETAGNDVVVTTASGVTFDGTNNTATADAALEKLELVYESATSWQIVANVGAVVLSSV